MTDRLFEQWRACAEAAADWRSGDDPEPVLEALALTVALELTSVLGRVPLADRGALRNLGQRAMLQLGGPERDEEELEALRMCAAIAREGLRALAGRPPTRPPEDAPPRRDLRPLIPPGDLTRLLRGELDGFAAGSLAIQIRRSEPAMAELRMLIRSSEATSASESADPSRPAVETIALAAAGPQAVLDPAQGRALGVHPTFGVEAVLFEEEGRCRLALYAEEPDPLRLVAAELTTEDVREGYWIGRVAQGRTSVQATLHVGERSEIWDLAW